MICDFNCSLRLVVLSILLISRFFDVSNAHHHHKIQGQQCRSGWSSTIVHFSQKQINVTAAHVISGKNQTATTGSPVDPTKQHVDVTGIPSNYEGIPINSTGGPVQSQIILQPVGTVKTNVTSTSIGNLIGLPCLDAGVLYSCPGCDSVLKGKDCYKKIGPLELESQSAGEIECTEWYTRTAYSEGGGVTMCGAKSGEIYQCSGDHGMTECTPCTQVGYVSKS